MQFQKGSRFLAQDELEVLVDKYAPLQSKRLKDIDIRRVLIIIL